ncbi:hypothetical protein F5883DRAFT_52681 [Diaporthe sp. PMI_573]|nr:hypothetical protein F5883DRAFT_52681 [Diaporthaceae sp. PMI_573]
MATITIAQPASSTTPAAIPSYLSGPSPDRTSNWPEYLWDMLATGTALPYQPEPLAPRHAFILLSRFGPPTESQMAIVLTAHLSSVHEGHTNNNKESFEKRPVQPGLFHFAHPSAAHTTSAGPRRPHTQAQSNHPPRDLDFGRPTTPLFHRIHTILLPNLVSSRASPALGPSMRVCFSTAQRDSPSSPPVRLARPPCLVVHPD